MRPQSKQKVDVRGTLIGGHRVLVCLPLITGEKSALIHQAGHLAGLKPDLIEWRIDGYDGVEDSADCFDALKAIRRQIGHLPLIFTFRSHSEGGARVFPQSRRLELIEGAIRSGLVDIVDIEMRNPGDFIDSVKEAARKAGTALLLSYHDFEGTPDAPFICDTLAKAEAMGADIVKMAVMPERYEDVLTLMDATLRARSASVRIPIVTMAMGRIGGITRIAGGLFGSDVTFAMGQDASAPGQIPIDRLRQAMDVVYND